MFDANIGCMLLPSCNQICPDVKPNIIQHSQRSCNILICICRSGGVVTDDGSFLFKNKVGGYASGKYSSWEFKENSERAYFAIYSQTLVLPDGKVVEQVR